MAPWLQRVGPWLGAALIGCTSIGLEAAAAPSSRGYRFRGVQAPQLKPNPLAGELEQKLQKLKTELKSRSTLVSLGSAIEQSLLQNPELALSYSQIQQAQWNLIAVRRQWYPTLSASSIGPAGGLWGYNSNTTRLNRSTVAGQAEENVFENREQLAARLSLDWTFFDPSRGPQINAANESLRSQQLLFNVTARNLVLQTQLAYFNLQEQQQLISSYEEILAATTKQVNFVEAYFNIGNASIADVEQMRTQQYQTLSLLIQTYLGLIDAAASLAAAMSLPAGQLVLPTHEAESYGDWKLPLAATIQQAQAMREEIQSSMAQASSAGWRASALFNRYWPRFALAANGSYVDFNSRQGLVGVANPGQLQSSSWDGAIGVGFNWWIFDGGIAAAEAQANKALARQYSDQAALQRLQITQEVEQSYASYTTSRLALQSSQEQATSARKAATAVLARFDVGFSDITSVVQTLNQAISAANAYSLSQRTYNSAIANLYRSSAQWPDRTLALRDQRVEQLKQR